MSLNENQKWYLEGREDEKLVNKAQAIALFESVRGRYIISQALHIGIETLEEVENPYKEQSNINDMKCLRDNLFPIYHDIEKNIKKILKVEK